MKLVKHITSNDQGVLRGINYVTTRLINEPVEVLQDVIDKVIKDEKNVLSKMLIKTTNFLKHQYASHMDDDKDCCSHGIDYVLGDKTSFRHMCSHHGSRNCKLGIHGCFRPAGFQVCRVDRNCKIKAIKDGDIITQINGILMKTILLYGGSQSVWIF